MVEEGKLLSVVIPVYNVKDYLGKTLDCIIEQTYKNWELILVDDGSDDGSLEIARAYCEKDERIRLYQRDRLPKGAPSCRNMGFELAKGDYLIYLDSDDIIAPYCFKQRVEYIEANDCDFAVFPLMVYYHQLFDAPGMVFGYKPKGDAVSALLARTLPFVVVSNIYKRERLVKSGVKWDTSFKSYQDSDYNLQAIKSGLSYKISNSIPDYFYRLSAQNSICKKLSTAKNCLSQIQFLEKQTGIYSTNKVYAGSLMVCAALIFQNILTTKNNVEISRKFISINLFSDKLVLKIKLKFLSWLSIYINNLKILDLFQLFLIPLFFLRFKILFLKERRYNRFVYREVGDVFEKSVDERIKKVIISRL